MVLKTGSKLSLVWFLKPKKIKNKNHTANCPIPVNLCCYVADPHHQQAATMELRVQVGAAVTANLCLHELIIFSNIQIEGERSSGWTFRSSIMVPRDTPVFMKLDKNNHKILNIYMI
jgi:hypothetical protein